LTQRYREIGEGLLGSKRLMKNMVEDVCATLGPGKVEEIVEKFKTRHGL
jgi:hypothetical protein